MDHRKEVLGEPVVASGDAAEVLQPEEPFDEVALRVDPGAEVRVSATLDLGGMLANRPAASMRFWHLNGWQVSGNEIAIFESAFTAVPVKGHYRPMSCPQIELRKSEAA